MCEPPDRVRGVSPFWGDVNFNHAEYMTTEWWRVRKMSYYMQHARRCAGCASTLAVELHHLSYENVYGEPDEDLLPLCEGCHAYVHIHHRKAGGDLGQATRFALHEMRRRPIRTEEFPVEVGHREPNSMLFATVRHAQAHAPTISRKKAKAIGRARFRMSGCG